MKKTNVLDILFVSFIFLFFVSFPFDLWIKSSFYLYLAETLARFIFVVFLLMYNHFKKLVTIPICHFKKIDLLLLPLLPILFCNFYYLLEMRNGFQITLDETFFIQIFFQISVALSEELLFRSLIENCLSLKKTLTRIFVSSLIFALFHSTYFFSSFNLISLFIPLYTFGLGFLLGFIYEWSEKKLPLYLRISFFVQFDKSGPLYLHVECRGKLSVLCQRCMRRRIWCGLFDIPSLFIEEG